jgi:glycine dehydrogenase subunit 1
MPFIPHTDNDVREMLAAIGAPSIDALFEEIPAALRIKSLARSADRDGDRPTDAAASWS